MTYNATYTTDDVAPMVVDGGLGIVAILISFATLVGLVLLYRWFKKKV